MPAAAIEIEAVLDTLTIPVEEIVRSGGGEGAATQRIRRAFADNFNWRKHNFEIRKIVDGEEKEFVSHQIDHVKKFAAGTFALEIEWNNKDPFFDRDLENFKRLHADGVISIGAIITRGETLQSSLGSFIREFAQKESLSSISDLERFYEPTTKQKRKIERCATRMQSFEEGWSASFVRDKFGQASTHWLKLQDRVQRGVGNPCPLLLIGIPADVMCP
jgi:hypothetical protein